tara:strand:+ start:395 stop:649 length:255 start_codon:yes stop_codon:yes gene_type:complete
MSTEFELLRDFTYVKTEVINLKHIHSIWRVMKTRTSFTIIKYALNAIRTMHNFSYKIPTEISDDFWENECRKHPTASTCKIYEG